MKIFPSNQELSSYDKHIKTAIYGMLPLDYSSIDVNLIMGYLNRRLRLEDRDVYCTVDISERFGRKLLVMFYNYDEEPVHYLILNI